MQSEMSANRIFVVLASIIPQTTTCFQIVTKDNLHLWHCRFRHLSFKGSRTLINKRMVKWLPTLKALSKVCSYCMVGKQHQEVITKMSLWRASQCLQLVHVDIYGPIKHESHNHKRYLINFIGDYSRKTCVYFLLENSEAFNVFMKFKALIERETGNLIYCLCTNIDGEFILLEFNQFCSTNGIARQLTNAYTP